jgi:transposase-like protein
LAREGARPSPREMKRTYYSDEFRIAIAKAYLAGVAATYLAQAFKINPVSVWKWGCAYRERGRKAFEAPGLTAKQRSLLRAVRRARGRQ